MTHDEFEALRQRAIQLRRYGHTRAQIREALTVSQRMLCRLLEGEPPPAWTARPRAKDELRARARELRIKGWTSRQIVSELGVAKGSVSLWVRDLPSPRERYDEVGRAKHASDARSRATRIARQQEKFAAGRQIGRLSKRELFVAGVVAYWAEGAKDKHTHGGRRAERVTFVNSDSTMISLFEAWLDLIAVPKSARSYRVTIHQSADAAGAVAYWAEVVGVDPGCFQRTTLKNHQPQTTRRNTGEKYHGCLTVRVRKSSSRYRRIEGWWTGIVAGVPVSEQPVLRSWAVPSPAGALDAEPKHSRIV
jgi:hypothetical protein